MKSFKEFVNKLYDLICGVHPYERPWHFQWLSSYSLRRDMKRILPTLGGSILDVGCGDQPYRIWLDASKVTKYLGIDVYDGPKVDLVIEPGEPWPIESASFDVVICNQVLEHVKELDCTLHEIHRVLKPGGTLLVSVPFVFNEHGIPYDYRRFTVYGMEALLEDGYEVVRVIRQGGVGSTNCLWWLNWLTAEKVTRLLTMALMPLWILYCFVVNMICFVLDQLDRTGAFYYNVFMLAKKKP